MGARYPQRLPPTRAVNCGKRADLVENMSGWKDEDRGGELRDVWDGKKKEVNWAISLCTDLITVNQLILSKCV